MKRAEQEYEQHIRSNPCWTPREAYLAGFKKRGELDAALHENMDASCDHEREHRAPGAGAMGVFIEYRDAIRNLDK